MANINIYPIQKKRAKSPLRCQTRLNGRSYTFNPKISIYVKDFKNGKIYGANSKALNLKLNAVRAAIINACNYYIKEFITPTQEDFNIKVQYFLTGKNAIDLKNEERDFILYVKKYIKNSDQHRKLYHHLKLIKSELLITLFYQSKNIDS